MHPAHVSFGGSLAHSATPTAMIQRATCFTPPTDLHHVPHFINFLFSPSVPWCQLPQLPSPSPYSNASSTFTPPQNTHPSDSIMCDSLRSKPHAHRFSPIFSFLPPVHLSIFLFIPPKQRLQIMILPDSFQTPDRHLVSIVFIPHIPLLPYHFQSPHQRPLAAFSIPHTI
ncbi:hypothetical protein P154DRAFT_86528 [Amniculicola lignicola CBS 123094]|uniref:Uncharacterized protein n=1 Tax=Amniculicola lignicola CBS 123094 TaxID=1392246 RepID=A0A6A5WNI7_9PLEO|nr:hypothetical protein P154DRAFT_86528 [Amniculicola lignicola CBS 123094]